MNRRRDVPGRVQTVRHEVSLRTLLVVPALLAGLRLLARLWPVLVLLLVALILAGTLAPALDWLERHRVRRPPALALLLLALALALTGLGARIVPALAGQVADLVAGAPALQ